MNFQLYQRKHNWTAGNPAWALYCFGADELITMDDHEKAIFKRSWRIGEREFKDAMMAAFIELKTDDTVKEYASMAHDENTINEWRAFRRTINGLAQTSDLILEEPPG